MVQMCVCDFPQQLTMQVYCTERVTSGHQSVAVVVAVAAAVVVGLVHQSVAVAVAVVAAAVVGLECSWWCDPLLAASWEEGS